MTQFDLFHSGPTPDFVLFTIPRFFAFAKLTSVVFPTMSAKRKIGSARRLLTIVPIAIFSFLSQFFDDDPTGLMEVV